MGDSNDHQQTKSTSPKMISSESQQISLVFATSALPPSKQVMELISSNNLFLLIPLDVMKIIIDMLDISEVSAFLRTCKYFRNPGFVQFFLLKIASDHFPDRATSGYVDAVLKDDPSICFSLCVRLPEPTFSIPNNFSMYIFTSSPEAHILSHTVRSMILHFHGCEEDYSKVQPFIKSFLQRNYFGNLQHLMLIGISINGEFVSFLNNLNLTVLCLKNFAKINPENSADQRTSLRALEKLKRLCISHPNRNGFLSCPGQLKELFIFCPKSEPSEVILWSKSESDETINPRTFFQITLTDLSAKLIDVRAHSNFKHNCSLILHRPKLIEKLLWNIPKSVNRHCNLTSENFHSFKSIYLRCIHSKVFKNSEDDLNPPIRPIDYPEIKLYDLNGESLLDGSNCSCGECPITNDLSHQ